jgi:predicted nuclease of predicted toxin-antitoxin system
VRLLLDEMFPPTVAEQLRARGHDAVSVHDTTVRLKGLSDPELFEAAMALDRVMVTENAADFWRLETEALADHRPTPRFIFTTNRQFPRGKPRTVGLLVAALNELMGSGDELAVSIFLRRLD